MEQWHAEYESGLAFADRQHRGLLNLNGGRLALRNALAAHLAEELEWMRESSYPDLSEQQALNAALQKALSEPGVARDRIAELLLAHVESQVRKMRVHSDRVSCEKPERSYAGRIA